MATRTVKGELSCENLIAAAGRVFRRKGYSASTVRDIAAEAGVALGGLYRHFSSKDEFVARVLADGMREISHAVSTAMEKASPQASFRDRVCAGMKAQIHAMRRHGESYDEAVRYQRSSTAPASVWKDYREEVDKYRLFWKRVFESAQRDGFVRVDASSTILTFYLLGAVTWVIQWQNPNRRSVERVADDFATFLLEGVASPKKKVGRK
jgi:AcrR family transcriptional regulator